MILLIAHPSPEIWRGTACKNFLGPMALMATPTHLSRSVLKANRWLSLRSVRDTKDCGECRDYEDEQPVHKG